MDLILSFVHPSRAPKALGPFASLWIDGESLRASADGPVLARNARHQWEVEGLAYYRLDCTSRVTVRFEDLRGRRSRLFGPFERFSAVDGLAYTDDQVFAYLDAKVGAWLCYDLGEHWPVMVVAEAAAARPSGMARSLVALAPLLAA